jgi:hypothetical protein
MCAKALAYSTASFPDRVPSFAKKKSDPKVARADSSLGEWGGGGGGGGGCA